MLNVCLTFDYELFLGKNYYPEEEILFCPTEEIRKALEAENVSATFFADVCSVLQSERLGRMDYVRAFRKQIQELYQSGQDIQLHIHPNWLRSSFIEGEWHFDQASYRLHSFGFDKKQTGNAVEIIQDSIQCLNGMLHDIDANYQCIAYRAGGFSIQPHRELVKTLYENGIRVDSSIAPHLISVSSTNSYDYRHETGQVNWWLSSGHEWWFSAPDEKGSLYEIPVATEKKNPLAFLAVRIMDDKRIKLRLGPRRGAYINEGKQEKNKWKAYWNYISGYNAISMDAYCAEFLYKQLVRYYHKHQCEIGESTIALIGHPKLSEDRYVANMRKLIWMIREDNRFCFCNINEAYQRVLREKEKWKTIGDTKK